MIRINLLFFILTGCFFTEQKPALQPEALYLLTMEIPDIVCHGCKKTISSELDKLNEDQSESNFLSYHVDVEHKKLTVQLIKNEEKMIQKISNQLTSIGYKPHKSAIEEIPPNEKML